MSHRLFVGLALPPPLRAALHGLQGGLRGARWVAPENLHLSLRFVGEVDRRQANDLAEELAFVRAAPFGLRLAGAGVFGSGRRPRVLWAGVAAEPALAALKRQVDAACTRAGFGPDERRFTPHITLARVKGGAPGAAERRASGLAGAVSGEFAVDAFVLFESHLRAEGAQYSCAAQYALEAP